jgi:hypothetical protein
MKKSVRFSRTRVSSRLRHAKPNCCEYESMMRLVEELSTGEGVNCIYIISSICLLSIRAHVDLQHKQSESTTFDRVKI